jgi:hypothetical protein
LNSIDNYQPQELAREHLGILFWFVLIGATFSSSIDALAWRAANFYYGPSSDRSIALAVMFLINASSTLLPFLLHKAKRRPRVQEVRIIDVMGISVLLWALNLLMAYVLSCGFGSHCGSY